MYCSDFLLINEKKSEIISHIFLIYLKDHFKIKTYLKNDSKKCFFILEMQYDASVLITINFKRYFGFKNMICVY